MKRLICLIFMLIVVFMFVSCGTDLQGDIIVKSDGKKVTVIPSRNADIETNTTVKDKKKIKPSAENIEVQQQQQYAVSYIANKNTKKFHYPDCNSVGQMKETNEVYLYYTRNEVIELGYSPCENCDP